MMQAPDELAESEEFDDLWNRSGAALLWTRHGEGTTFRELQSLPTGQLDAYMQGKIQRDLHRTYSDAPLFRRGRGQVSKGECLLQDLLNAYAVYDDLGYCQGMNFVAARILVLFPFAPKTELLKSPTAGSSSPSVSTPAGAATTTANDTDACALKEESGQDRVWLCKAFWLFVAMMDAFKGMFQAGLPAYTRYSQVFSALLPKVCPEAHTCLEKQGIPPCMYLAGWWLSLFAHEELPNALTLGVWRAVFPRTSTDHKHSTGKAKPRPGMPSSSSSASSSPRSPSRPTPRPGEILVRVALALCVVSKSKILQSSGDGLPGLLRDLPMNSGHSAHTLLRCAWALDLEGLLDSDLVELLKFDDHAWQERTKVSR